MKKSDILKHFGGTSAVAKALTKAGYPCTKQAVHQWREEVPKHRRPQILSILDNPEAVENAGAKDQLRKFQSALKEVLEYQV